MKRQKFSSSQKVKILREHLEGGLKISEICEKYQIHPNLFYRWKKSLFEGALDTFSPMNKRTDQAKERETQRIKEKIAKKDEVIAELLEENIRLKKIFGEI